MQKITPDGNLYLWSYWRLVSDDPQETYETAVRQNVEYMKWSNAQSDIYAVSEDDVPQGWRPAVPPPNSPIDDHCIYTGYGDWVMPIWADDYYSLLKQTT